jgi:hypothetical protein
LWEGVTSEHVGQLWRKVEGVLCITSKIMGFFRAFLILKPKRDRALSSRKEWYTLEVRKGSTRSLLIHWVWEGIKCVFKNSNKRM